MPITNEKYDQLKIDRLKHFLTDMAAKGQPRPYEIFVDGLKVVPKTEDPKEFDNYEYYMNEDTEKIRILIFNSMASPRNDQYCYYVQQQKEEKPLDGIGTLDGIIQEKLQARDREHEVQRMRQELQDLKEQLQEAEEYAEDLEQQLIQAKDNKHKLGKLDLVELGSAVLERVAAKNAGVLEKYGLSGLVSPPAATEQTQQTEASFERTGNQPAGNRPELMQYLPLLEQLDKAFEEPQLKTVMEIIRQFTIEPSQLQTVAELLNIEMSTP